MPEQRPVVVDEHRQHRTDAGDAAVHEFVGNDVAEGLWLLLNVGLVAASIAVLALGRKDSDEPFNSEDLGLLTAVAGQVATAIENGRLYRQLHLKAEELGRMREFNENILESLDSGLVVFDGDERIVRWNHALESFYGVPRAGAIGRTLGEVFDLPLVEALRDLRSQVIRHWLEAKSAPRSLALVSARRGEGKTFVAAVVLQLAEEGKIGLDDKLEKWLGKEPWYGRLPNGPDLTVRHLLTHTAGLPEYFEAKGVTAAVKADPDRVWQSVQTEIRRVLDQHGLAHVRVERADQPSEQAAGGKYRTVIPLQ